MARYKVILTYDGTYFFGWQRQAQARTVQGEVEKALKQIGWQGQSILAAGRTDTGVHASGQVIAFDIDWQHSIEDLHNAMNANLPMDVAAKHLQKAELEFHPRYDATVRLYRYHTFSQAQRDPLRERFSWRVWPAVTIDRMQSAANQLVGTHDFAAFGTATKPGGSTSRQVFSADWFKIDDEFVFEISANAFLYHMVRRCVKLLVEIGQGKLEPEIVTEYLQNKVSVSVQGLAPASGLFLDEVRYD